MANLTRTLGEICDDVEGVIRTGPFGSQLHQDDYSADGVPVVMPKNIVAGQISTADIARVNDGHAARLTKHQLKAGDIVYGRRGDIGRRALITNKEKGWLCGTGCLRLSLGGQVLDPHFLYYYLGQQSVSKWILNQAVGATLPNLNTSIIRSVEISFPDIQAQRDIASILTAYDDLIENNTRRIRILEEMVQSLYREWFVHFRFPGHEKVKLVNSRLGKIPESWKVKRFSETAEYVNGYAFKPEHWGEIGKPIIKIKELKNGVTNQTPRYSGDDLAEKYFIKNGDILFSWSGDLNAYIWAEGDALLNQHLFHVVPRDDFHRLFLFFSLKHRMEEFRSRSLGTTMRHIKRSALKEVELIVPEGDMRNAFEANVYSIIESVRNLNDKNKHLRCTRDLLLPKLLSGDIQF